MNMPLGQLLVHVDASSRCAVRLELARSLARTLGTSLGALYAATPSIDALPAALQAEARLAVALHGIDEDRRIRARATFDHVMDTPGPAVTWAVLGHHPVSRGFAHQALCADLMVLGQPDPSEQERAEVPPDFVESVMMASGKPAIILPWAGVPGDLLGTIVIAWKQTPQAARAVCGALPLLQRARRVHVVAWEDASHDGVISEGTSLSLHSYLLSHAIEATWHRPGTEPERLLGELLLSTAFDLDASLLVMDCYGHSRAREWVLGGVSRTILQSMTMPVLMAH